MLGRQAGGMAVARLSASGTGFGALQASTLGGVAPTHMATYARDGVLLAGQANASVTRAGR
jgi:hypothetical protein